MVQRQRCQCPEGDRRKYFWKKQTDDDIFQRADFKRGFELLKFGILSVEIFRYQRELRTFFGYSQSSLYTVHLNYSTDLKIQIVVLVRHYDVISFRGLFQYQTRPLRLIFNPSTVLCNYFFRNVLLPDFYRKSPFLCI